MAPEKTTIFNMLTGVYSPTSGQIKAYGQELRGLKPYEITAYGLARTFQNIRLFKDLSVLDNLMIALDHDPKLPHFGMWTSALRTRRAVTAELSQERRALEILEIFQLTSRKKELARNLPYGDQRRLEIARAMGTGAKLLLLDEPAAGMNAHETAELMKTIRLIRDKHRVTILLIEHDNEVGHGNLRAHCRVGLRSEDCGGIPVGDSEKSSRHRSLFG